MDSEFRSINPYTNQVLSVHRLDDLASARTAVLKSWEAFQSWKIEPPEIRLEKLKALSDLLLRHRDRLAKTMTEEMGKPITQSLAEVDKCSHFASHISELFFKYAQTEYIETEYTASSVEFAPLGPILGVMPWNFPVWQVFRFALPALSIGNTILLKPAPSVIATSQLLETIFNEAGFQSHVFCVLSLNDKDTQTLITDPKVRGLSFTGSTCVGRELAALAARNLKPAVIELGGSDPYVVLEDADLEKTARACIQSRLINSGQTCISAKRFLVQRKIKNRFLELIIAELRKCMVGDPLDPKTLVGPLARMDITANLARQVQDSIFAGGTVEFGDLKTIDMNLFSPMVLSNVDTNAAIYSEEFFGPVALLNEFETDDDAVRLANCTPYGLGAAVFSTDIIRAKRVASKIDAGTVAINDIVKSDIRFPFGGVKDSGFGRELSRFGFYAFANIKTTVIR